ncbi:putative helicase MOV-10 [Rhinophrynus dorsalis]
MTACDGHLPRDGQRKPNFSNAIHALIVAGKADVRRNKITFGKFLRRTRVTLPDQYWAIRRDNQENFTSGPSPGSENNRTQVRKILKCIKKNRSQFINSNAIHISSDHDLRDGRIRFSCLPSEEKIFHIHIKNISEKPVTFVQYNELYRMHIFSFRDEHNVSKASPLLLNPGDIYDIAVRCSLDCYGYFPVTMVFEFMRENNTSGLFRVGRFLSAVCRSKLVEDLEPTSRYVPYQRNLAKPVERIVEEGFSPENSVNIDLEQEITLGQFRPPDYLKDSIKAGVFSKSVSSNNFSSADKRDMNLLSSPLDFNNYNKRFHLLLYLEEIQMEIDIRRYDKFDQKMEKDPNNKRLLTLNVPGVAENRPSVLKGDHLFVTLSDERGKPGIISYKGYVHGVEMDKVKLGFSQNLLKKFIPGMSFDVTFTFNRLPLRVQHRAADLAKENSLSEFLFPTYSYGKCIINPQTLSLFDRSLESNPEQYNAVKQIVSGISRPAPYIIFGPPGTGKTVTLVEAIKQVLKCIPSSCVLACAPSNSAADLLCERLMKHVDRRQIYRILASSRDFQSVPEDIKPVCNWNSSKESYVYPCKDDLKEYRVIITTLITASRLVSANFPHGYFSHVFIDEAGHAVEPECVTAIAGILDVMDTKNNMNGGQLVLAGDQQQLGPVLRSPVAIQYGLGMSLLERLMKSNPLYSKGDDGFNSQFVTKLLRNYRSHPDILKIPNELFYDNELQASADEMITHCYCKWEKLPCKNFPVVFHGVLGKDDREANSPSFFNAIEIQELITYLECLLKTQGKKGLAKISPKEIGIISPYRKQVEKIRKAVNMKFGSVHGIKSLKIGSVEEFQGQERKVILVSTVRSTNDYVKFDEDFSLGFLKNPKRFNVAITRAKSLLIMVGNPAILSKDSNWSRFLQHCQEKGGYTGFKYENTGLDEDKIAELLSDLDLNATPPGEETGESFVQQQAEPSWRHEH